MRLLCCGAGEGRKKKKQHLNDIEIICGQSCIDSHEYLKSRISVRVFVMIKAIIHCVNGSERISGCVCVFIMCDCAFAL